MAECTCAMTESSLFACPRHGEDSCPTCEGTDMVPCPDCNPDSVGITHLVPCPERNHTMSKKDSDFQATIARQQAEIEDRDKTIAGLKKALANRNQTVSFANEEIAKIKQSRETMRKDLGIMRKDRDALVTDLHRMANEAESTQTRVETDDIDDLLEELNLPSRKKPFEIIITVPVQVRVECEAKDKQAARDMFTQGKIEWRVEDFEETIEDDTEIIEVIEKSS